MSESDLTHLDESGAARMVDVGDKSVTRRIARASGRVSMGAEALGKVAQGSAKGDALQVARIAGIQGAKRAADLIPLCHPLSLDSVTVDLTIDRAAGCVRIEAEVRCSGRTGVEMEALTAVATAALALYDMVKSVDKGLVIEAVQLDSKEGGRSGTYERGRTS